MTRAWYMIGILLAYSTFSAIAWYFDVGHESVEKLPNLNGKTMESVIADLGPPSMADDFKLDQPLPEFRIEIYNTYPPDDPAPPSVEIRERRWQRARYTIAVWFHRECKRWVAFNTCRWKSGVVF